MKKNISLAEKIALIAKHSGKSQVSIANKVEIPASHINHFLKGKGDIRSDLFIRILKELNIDIEEVITSKLSQIVNSSESENIQTAGDALEKLLKMMEKPERKSAIDYLEKYSKLAIGPESKPYTKIIKTLI